jgi:DNA helicase-2/ATP-dependent DNA helicase PcrA
LTDNEEGRVISSKIFDLKQGGIPTYNDFAILYRTNKQSRSFEEALRKLNIPYKIYGGVSFYQRKEIKDLLSYFRLTTNPRDEEALKRVINYPKRGIGKTSIENMIIAANTYGVSMWDVISNMNQYPVALNAGTKAKLYEFTTMINSFSAQLDKLNAYDLAQTIAKSSGILRELHGEKDKGPEEVERYQNVEELLAGIKEFTISKEEDSDKSLAEFMIDVALLTDADLTSENEEKNHVTMMTIHSSKGLEFPHVFLVGLEENLFPSQMALHSRTELEEERRLFYVALTRAMNSCTLSYASSRFNWGQLVTSEPSRFIDEIEQSYLEFESPQRGGGRSLSGRSSFDQPHTGGLNKSFSSSTPPPTFKPMQQASGATKSPGSNENLKVGYIVNHDRFGKGKVTKLEGDGADKKATIFFPHHGAKTVLLRFANLTILEE